MAAHFLNRKIFKVASMAEAVVGRNRNFQEKRFYTEIMKIKVSSDSENKKRSVFSL